MGCWYPYMPYIIIDSDSKHLKELLIYLIEI
jgi:hypothetical protein